MNAEGVITGVRKGSTSVAVKTHNGLIQAVEVNVKARLKDVYGSLTNDPATYALYAQKLGLERDEDAPAGTVVCRDGELALSMTSSSCTVAVASSDGVEQRAFTRAGDETHFIAIATADGATIQGILAQWNWQ